MGMGGLNHEAIPSQMSDVRVLACFKATPDFEALREADWAGAAAGVVETRYVRRVLNCFDESALEVALRLSESAARRGVRVELDALSVGGREVEPYLKTLVVLGYERATRVPPEAADAESEAADAESEAAGAESGLDFAPGVVASIIAAYARRVAHSDLVVLGWRSGPGDSSTVPFRVAEALGWPCLTQVTEVEPLSDDRLRVACVADDGPLRLTLRGPCVLAVGNAVVSHLRVPTLQDRLARRDRPIDVLAAADLGVDIAAQRRRETCLPTAFETIDRSRRAVVIEGRSPHDKAQTLFDSRLRDIMETL
jgi:electron transfer flavoprotein beta subunit